MQVTVLNTGDNLFYDKADAGVSPRFIYGDSGGILQVSEGGNDTIYGLAGSDAIYGDAETIVGVGSRGGDDQLFGGAGDDGVFGDARSLAEGAQGGADVLVLGARDNQDIGYGDAFIMTGGAVGGNDYIRGHKSLIGDADEMFDAIGGNDTLDASFVTAVPGLDGSDIYGDGRSMRGASVGGDDVITGTDIPATITGDFLVGDGYAMRGSSRGGNDLISGLEGRNYIHGDAYEMYRSAVGGDDDLRGGADGDEIYGDARVIQSRDVICGNDVIRGGGGDDEIYGDAWLVSGRAISSPGIRFGNDVIRGDTGDDVMWGDTERGTNVGVAVFGDDRFHFAGAFGEDVIGDFGNGADRLIFEGFRSADISVDQTGPDTIISVVGGRTVTLVGYTDELIVGDDLFFV